jgi:arylformamidase
VKIYDASLTVTPRMAIWPGNPGVEIERVKSLEQGGSSNVSRLSLGVHTGTHVDAPVHFLPNGADVTALPLDVLTGEAYVVHLPDVSAISAEVLERQPLPAGATRLLFRTRNSDLWARGDNEFSADFVALTEDAARWVVDHAIRLVGIDYLSIQRYKDGTDTHRILLGAGVVVVEGLNLAHIVPGRYDFYCLPLKLLGADGAPARAILISGS